jgi:Lrp/AsnC family transcriptional regulator, leucine-responsive regulatory protein
MPIELDDFDLRIISALHRNGRLSNLELQDMVKLSHSAISRRIAKLESDGVIQGYTAKINNTKLGLTVRAFVGVTRDSSANPVELARRLAKIDGIRNSYVVTGDQDVFLEVLATDLQAFADLMLKKVQTATGVATTRSIFIMEENEGRGALS